MQNVINNLSPTVWVINEPKTLTIKLDKKKVKSWMRRLAIILIYALLFVSIIHTYIQDSPMFYPLAQVGFVLSILAFLNLLLKSK